MCVCSGNNPHLSLSPCAKIDTYKIQLPNDIPPSHRGKAIRFNYYLVVGAQRAPTGATAKPGLPTQGQVVQIRFRVLNHVSEDGSRPIYDLMNPVVRYKDEAVVDEYNATKAEEKPVKQPKKPAQQLEERKAFMDYVNELFENSTQNHTIHEITRRESDAYEERSADEQILDKSCSQVVSRITHRSRKGKAEQDADIRLIDMSTISHVRYM